MKIVLFASGDFAVPTLRSLTDPAHPGNEVVCVITQPDRASGRGRKAKPTPVREWAEELGLPVIATEDVNTPEMVAKLRDLRADLGLVIAFGQKIGGEARSVFPHECVNLHASILPKYRGAAPFQWTVINGDEQAGVTVFRLVDRMDAGPVYVTRSTGLREDERACELHDRLSMIGVDAVNATLELLENDPGFEPVEQDHTQATKAPKLSKEDGHIRFDQTAKTIANHVCGLWDWPGAKCIFESTSTGKRETVTLALARVGDRAPANEPPGTIDARRYVATADGYLEVLEIKPDGARVMTFQDFVNGRHVQAGDHFAAIAAAQ
ncbi:MAG: methionyl-tRNA formyltransferase [Phycisphaerales bacterium]|nr:methionyl-tRNA formyltransferase [Phycisphaerales bacterium]